MNTDKFIIEDFAEFLMQHSQLSVGMVIMIVGLYLFLTTPARNQERIEKAMRRVQELESEKKEQGSWADSEFLDQHAADLAQARDDAKGGFIPETWILNSVCYLIPAIYGATLVAQELQKAWVTPW